MLTSRPTAKRQCKGDTYVCPLTRNITLRYITLHYITLQLKTSRH